MSYQSRVRSGTLVCLCRGEIPLRFFEEAKRYLWPKFVGPARDNAILLLHSSFSILHSSELDFISQFFIWNGLVYTSTFFIWNGLDFISIIFIWNRQDFTSTFFVWNLQANFSFGMDLTLLAHCSFSIRLELTDWTFLSQGQEAQGSSKPKRRWAAF